MLKIKHATKIPEEYKEEFALRQKRDTQKSVYLLCALSLIVYFLAVILFYFISPEQFTWMEIGIGALLLVSAVLILKMNIRAPNLFRAKANAFLFAIIILVLMTKLSISYNDTPILSSSIFVFTMFLVSVTVPWPSRGVFFLGIIHIFAYSFGYYYVKTFSRINPENFRIQNYLDGLLFIVMTIFLCWVVRRHETNRDVENFILLKQVEDKNEQMRKELEWATRVHKSIISGPYTDDNVDIAVNYLPVYYIGGDYARFNFVDGNRLIFMISDVTGHGIPAALLVNRLHSEFERMGKAGQSPGSLLKELNAFIKEDFDGSDMYMSAFCGLVDFKAMTLVYSNYGHPPQYLYSAENAKISGLSSQTSLLGVPLLNEGDKIYQEEVAIGKGDKIILYTDGVTETMDSKEEEFGAERMEKYIIKNHGLQVGELNNTLLSDLDAFKDGPFQDDVCLMSIEIKSHQTLFSIGSQIFKHGE